MQRKEKYVQLQSNPPLKEATLLERERETQKEKRKKNSKDRNSERKKAKIKGVPEN